MTTLHLTNLDPSRKVRATQGIRGAAQHLGVQMSGSDAYNLVKRFLSTGQAQFIAQHPSEELVEQALTRLTDAGASGTLNLYHDAHERVVPEGDDNDALDRSDEVRNVQDAGNEGELVSFEATQAAAILMFLTDGNPSYALSAARSFGNVTEDELWEEVAVFLRVTFPPVPQQQQGNLPPFLRP